MDRYAIERLLGSGSMGSVYLAYDRRLHRRVALKILGSGAEHLGIDAIALAMREARAAGAIAHPNAAAVFDADTMNGAAYIVMEYVPGQPLRRSIGDPAVPMSLRVRWLVEVASALAAAHDVGVVHRDVKPENVIIRNDGMAKVLDFGVARITERRDDRAANTLDSLTWTNAGAVVGTPGYMAPEIVLGRPADARADQFGWGVLAHELLSGKLPWNCAGNALGIMASALTEEPQPLGADIAAPIAAAVSRALSKSPDDRFGSLTEIVARLLDFADVGPWRVPFGPAGITPPSVRWKSEPCPRPDEPAPPAHDIPPVRRSSGSRPDDGPSSAPRSSRPHDPPPDEMPASRRRESSLPDEITSASSAGWRRTDTRPSDSGASTSAARRRTDTRPSDSGASPNAARRRTDMRHDEPASPSAPRRRGDSRPDDAPISSGAGTRSHFALMPPPPAPAHFRAPDFAAPVHVEAQIALLPPSATCKGMFFTDLLALASRSRSVEEIASLAGLSERRYVSFRDYPMADMMRLTAVVAQAVYPSVPIGEGLRRLGRRALSLVLDCHAGRTLLGVLPREPGAYLLHGPKACRLLMGGLGELTAERLARTLFRVHARGMPIFLETYQIGVLESVLLHCYARGDVEIAMHGLADATASVRVW